MLKALLRVGGVIAILVLGLGLGLGVGTILAKHNSLTSAITRSTKTVLPAIVKIPRAQDLFEPFIVTVQPGTVVTWQNNDTVAHIFTTTPDANHFLNPQSFALSVAAGKKVTFTFTKAGLYHYYEKTANTWNTEFSRVAAKKGNPHFPIAMDGIIWVQGPISGLPSAAINYVPNGHDDFAYEFLAIQQPGSVSWHNFDTDPHFIGLVPSWLAPVNPSDIGLYRIAGTDDLPGGDTVTVVFDKPGLYYYYCRNHDRVEPTTHRAQALTKASEYPIAMEGFILVVQ